MFNLIKPVYPYKNVKEYYKKVISATAFHFVGLVFLLVPLNAVPIALKEDEILIAVIYFLVAGMSIIVVKIPFGLIDHIANMILTLVRVSNKNSEI